MSKLRLTDHRVKGYVAGLVSESLSERVRVECVVGDGW